MRKRKGSDSKRQAGRARFVLLWARRGHSPSIKPKRDGLELQQREEGPRAAAAIADHHQPCSSSQHRPTIPTSPSNLCASASTYEAALVLPRTRHDSDSAFADSNLNQDALTFRLRKMAA